MEGFGVIVTIILGLLFAVFSFEGVFEHFLEVHLNNDWKCTQSIAVSAPDVKPVVESCTQYTLQPTK